MNQNGFSEINTHDGTVFVEGDMNIDGNLSVTGTINGGTGPGGSVNNPMTEDLQAGGYAIYNISEITGQEGVLSLSSTINLQDNNIEGVNTIKVDKITTQNPENYFIDCDSKIFNNAGAFTLNNGLSFSSIHVPEPNYVLTVESPATTIGYKKAVFNPVEETVNMNSKNIDNCDTLDVHFIRDTTENKVKFLSVVHTLQPLYCFQDIVMNFKRIYYCNSLIAAHNESGLGLDMIPATVGLPGQVLARDPAYNPNDPNTYKLVWVNQSSGGGVTNPMSANLLANDFNIYQANILEGKNILVMAGGGGIACNAGGSSVPVTWLLAIKKSTSPFYQTFNTDYITPQTIAGVTIDSKWEDGTTDTQISLQTPTLNINNSTNLSPTNISITGNIQITQGSGYIHGNNLIVRGRTSANVNTNLTLEGVTTAINSTTLNITSTSNVIAGNTNFTGTLRTNFIDTHTGGNIAILQNLTMSDGKRINTNSIYTNSIRPYINSELAITGLQSDNKTLSNITLSAPVITINNIFGSLTPESCIVDFTGTLRFSNSATLSLIRGGYISVDSKYADGQQTPLYLKGSTVEMTSTDTDIKITVPANNYIDLQGTVLVGDGITSQLQVDTLYQRTGLFIKSSNFSTRYRLYSHMHALDNNTNSRNVRTSLFKYYGPQSLITALNTINPTLISTSNGAFVGSKIQDTSHLNSGDKLCFTLTGLLTTAGGGSMNIYVYAGVAGSLVQVTSFTKTNITLNNELVKITIDCDIIKSPGANSLSNVAFCTLHRNDNSVCNLVGTIGSTIPDDAQTQYEVYASHTVAQAGSTFKLLTYSMELY